MDGLSRTERAALCDLLDEVGPGAPTLCTGWATFDLAAHLVLRERNPAAAAATGLPGADRLARRGIDKLKARLSFAEVVERVRNGPPRWSVAGWPRVEPAVNTIEFLVHHEDVLRAVRPGQRRDLSIREQDAVWSRLRWVGKAATRREPTGVELVRTDVPASFRIRRGQPSIALRGLPSELALYLCGRTSVADVEVEGPAEAVAAWGHRTV